MNHLPMERVPFDHPTAYRIRVQGRVASDQADYLGGMTIGNEVNEIGTPVTTLVGEVSDQAALMGMLNTLYELHLTVLSVECLASG
jgi:hypothetical protein